MKLLKVPPPVSTGLILSYKCNISCSDCIYACSPKWSASWINREKAKIIFSQLSPILKQSLPAYAQRISFSYGLHFTGGEPFLNYDLLLELTRLASEMDIPLPFVETNCFWARDNRKTEEKLAQLKASGLKGILLSVNPFNIEYIPFERIKRAVSISKDVFGHNAIIYQEFYYQLFQKLSLKGNLTLKQLLELVKPQDILGYIELLPMGRTAYKLEYLFEKHPPAYFFGQDCIQELTRNWHTHIDNYMNYVPGFCAGLSLGKAESLHELFGGINLDKKPVIKALSQNIKLLYTMGKSFGYKGNPAGYISKCHLCTDIRRYLVSKTDKFEELNPLEYYQNL